MVHFTSATMLCSLNMLYVAGLVWFVSWVCRSVQALEKCKPLSSDCHVHTRAPEWLLDMCFDEGQPVRWRPAKSVASGSSGEQNLKNPNHYRLCVTVTTSRDKSHSLEGKFSKPDENTFPYGLLFLPDLFQLSLSLSV